QAAFRKLQQVRAVEARVLQAVDVLFDFAVDDLNLLRRGAVRHDEAKGDTAQVHPLVVLDCLLEQLRVGAYDLFAAQAPNAGRLQAHVFNAAGNVAHHSEGARFEGLVQTDGRRGEKVAQDHLRRQGHGHTADAQACD